MYRYLSIFLMSSVVSVAAFSQKPVTDSTLYYDDLFSALDDFLDSLTRPRTMLVVNAEAGSTYFNYASSSATRLDAEQKLIVTPSIGFFHKTGLGVTGAAAVIRSGNKYDAYQFSVTGSYDYLKSMYWGSGLSITHFITKDSLDFYTSPLQNEAAGYFTYKGWWVRPIISAAFGWGSRKSREERQDYITLLRLRPSGYTQINTEESVSDLSVAASLKHDFYWLEKLGKKNVLRFTPQITFTSGTQNFGFNQTTTTSTFRNNKVNILSNSENVYLDDSLKFQPLSLTTFLRGEVSFGKFFIQPQMIFDYYFPAKSNRLTTGFRLNVGVSL